jgi:sn-glycerol 3-phosphate transport system substrate-binding protein
MGRRTSMVVVVLATMTVASLVACSETPDARPDGGSAGATLVDPPGPTNPDASPDASTDPSTDPSTDVAAAGARCDITAARDEPRTIEVWYGVGGDLAMLFEQMVKRFESEHPGITVITTSVDGYAVGLERFRTSNPADLPDLFMGQAEAVRLLHDGGGFVPPGECIGAADPSPLDDLLPVVAGTYSVDGVLQAYPFNVSSPVLLYDRARFEQAGLDPDRPPTDMEAVRATIEQLIETGAAKRGLVLYDRSASWFIEQWSARAASELVEPGNGHGLVAIDEVSFDNDVVLEALGWLRRATDDGLTTWIGLNTSGIDDLFAMVGDDAASFTLHTSAAVGDILRLLDGDDNPQPLVRLGVAPLPFPGAGSLVGGGGVWLVDKRNPGATGAAALLGEWLMAPAQQAEWGRETGSGPATTAAVREPDLLARWAEAPELAVGYHQLADSSTTPAALGMQVIPRLEIQRVLELAAAEAVTGDRDLGDILRDAAAAAAELIERFRPAG